MCHSLRPEGAAAPRLLDGVGTRLNGDLGSEVVAITTQRSRRPLPGEARHAGHRDPEGIAQRRQAHVLAVAAPRRLAQPLAAEQITLKAVRYLAFAAAGHRGLHQIAGSWGGCLATNS